MHLKDLIELSKQHPYYCSESNYYSNEPNEEYETMEDFLDEWFDADVDYNHVFRWDVSVDEDDGNVYAQVFVMLQRKGIFKPIYIENFEPESVDRFVDFIRMHEEVVKKLWNL